ncbi:hypothetical protein C0Q44_00580 [Paenibacillus sp. PCH8]|uniref:hypothetical protein n=1 Tax=Paenibacillus sp. PCH8 TaxID=2066524 RepID=UPI000CF87BB1|nr:hypothetical protein [Paenibacillus sp. PCH8]PQP83262.1 hypothetical protein C0Q44_00580 [Paenibacillus sp. PCH8]
MDYELFLQSKLDRNSLGELIEQYITESVVEKASFQSNEEEIVIGSRFFTLHLEIEDISDITFVRQHYNLDVNVCIRTQLFGSTFSEGIKHIFRIISKLIKHTEGNLLLLEDGSTQLLRMENGLLAVNNRLDEYQSKYLTPSLLLLLDRPYIEKELSS